MSRFTKRKRWLAGIAALGSVSAVFVAAWFVISASSNDATSTQGWDGSSRAPVGMDELRAAGYALTKAGWNLTTPTYLPRGFVITRSSLSLPSEGQGVSALKRTYTVIERRNATLTFLAVNSPFTFEGDDAAHVIASPAKGANIYKVAGPQITDYTLLTPTRGYVLTFRSSDLSEAEAVKLLSSLPME